MAQQVHKIANQMRGYLSFLASTVTIKMAGMTSIGQSIDHTEGLFGELGLATSWAKN
jgi:hypothetical protein